MKLAISIDDGGEQDMKFLDLLVKYDLAHLATFYVPSCTLLSESELRDIAARANLGGHTVSHPSDLKLLDAEELNRELTLNREWLKDFGGDVKSFAYPRGRFNQETKEAVVRAGFDEARTTRVLCTEQSKDPYETDTTIHMHQRKEYVETDWFDMARSYFKVAEDKGEIGYFHMWCHSSELTKSYEWEKAESLLEYISERYANT